MIHQTEDLSAEELIRYSRHIQLPNVGIDGQRKLKSARVLIIGLGGLGCPIALYLAAAGIGTIGLADFDRVEMHNLQRQILHNTETTSSSKIDSALKTLEKLNPDCNYIKHPEGIIPDNACSIFKEYDFIIDGSDNFPARYLVNDAALLTNKPVVYGSLFQFEGQVTLFSPKEEGPCYRCLFPEMPTPGSVPNCEEAGVFGALCGTIGSLQAMEAIKWILNIGEPLIGRLIKVDALSMRIKQTKIKKDSNCPLCSSTPKIKTIENNNYTFECPNHLNTETIDSMQTTSKEDCPIQVQPEVVKAWIDTGEHLLLLDVREDYEVDICKINGAVHIPMQSIPNNAPKLPKDKTIIVYCHHGGRSLYVTNLLREQGFQKTTSLIGGIDSWSMKIDPKVKRY